MEYVCVDKLQKESDPHHANWMDIQAKSKNEAKTIYSKQSGTKYIDAVCVLKSKFVKL